MTESWSTRRDVGRQAAEDALARAGFGSSWSEPGPRLIALAGRVAEAVAESFAPVLDAIDEELDDEARRRVLKFAVSGALWASRSSLADAMASELARPDPQPFTPPLAGSWLRSRRLPRPAIRRLRARTVPEWDGAWHVFSGDIRNGDERTHDIAGRALCGVELRLRGESLFDGLPSTDYVVAERRPGVDACRRCERIARTQAER
jgi:hypothetical protein